MKQPRSEAAVCMEQKLENFIQRK